MTEEYNSIDSNNNDEQEIDEQKYFFGDAVADGFRILKNNMGFTVLMIIAIWLLTSVANIITSSMEVKTMTVLVDFPKMLIVNCAEIGLVVIACNYLKNDDHKLRLGESIKSKIYPLIVTNIMLGIILFFILIVLGIVVSGLLTFIVGSTIMSLFTILLIFGASIYVAVRFAFITQAVVLQDFYYGSAINNSMALSKGRGFTIIGIIIFPELVTLVPEYLLKTFVESYPVPMAITTGFFTAITTVFSVSAITALYLHVRKEKMPRQLIKDEETYEILSE